MMPALPVHHTATEDSAWDGPAAVAAMPADDAVLRYCHAWQTQAAADADHKSSDDDVDDQKGSYKFPHHRKQGGAANIPACNNGKARLSTANIPDGDRAGVERHLQAHIDDAKGSDDSDGENRQRGGLTAMRFPGERSIDLTNLAGGKPWQRAMALAAMTDEQRAAAHAPRARLLAERPDWYRITDFTDGTPARLDIYSEIGESWFGDSTSALSFKDALDGINAPSIEVHVNSPGGDVFDGLAILNLLRSSNKPIDVVIDGLAASAASFIAQAGDTVTMMPNSQMMIHDASGFCIGNPQDMTDMAELLDRMSDNISQVYALRSGRPASEWRDAMRTETWYSPEEAVQAGLADKVGTVQRGQKTTPEPEPAPAWNLSFYRFDGRASAPGPLSSAPPDVSPPTGAAPAPTTTTLSVEQVRAAFRGAFPSSKEARR